MNQFIGMMKLNLLISLLICAVYNSCQSKASNTDDKTEINSLVETEVVEDKMKGVKVDNRMESFVVIVDDLRVRSEPGLETKVVFGLKLGDLVYGKGIVSERTDKVELRGEIYNSPYHKVTFGNEFVGWVYGAGLQRIGMGKISQPKKISDLVKFGESLNLNSVTSGGKMLNYISNNFSEEGEQLMTGAVIILEKFLNDSEIELWDVLDDIPWPENVDVKSFINSDLPIFNRLSNSGFKVEASEGMFYPVIDWGQINDELGGKTLPSMQAYLDLKEQDSRIQVESDAAIIIPIDQLGEMAIRWEKFNRSNPKFVIKEQSIEIERRYKMLTLTGMDNSPAFDWEGKVVDEFREGWVTLVKNHPDSDFAGAVKNIVEKMESSGWKKTNEIDKYIDNYLHEL